MTRTTLSPKEVQWGSMLEEDEGVHIIWIDSVLEKEERVAMFSYGRCDDYMYKCLISLSVTMFLAVIGVIIYVFSKK